MRKHGVRWPSWPGAGRCCRPQRCAHLQGAAAPPPTNWTGSYLGLSGGGVWGNAKVYSDDDRRRRDTRVRPERWHYRRHRRDFSSRAATWCSASRATPRSPTRTAAPSRCRQRRLQQRGQGALAFDLPRPHRRTRTTTGCSTRPPAARSRACRHSIASPAGVADLRNATGIGAGPPAQASRSRSTRTGRRRSSTSTSACRTNRTSIRRRASAFQSDQRVRLDDHIVRVGVNYKLPWTMLDGFFKKYRRRSDRRNPPRPARDRTAFPSRARACRCRPRRSRSAACGDSSR